MSKPIVSKPPYTRVHHFPQAQRAYGPLAERLVDALGRGDPLADAAVEGLKRLPVRLSFEQCWQRPDQASEEVRALLADARNVPEWVDWERVDRAGRIFFRAGVLGGLTLAFRSLVGGYCAPAGNKPLALSGRLTQHADRRLAETGYFAQVVAQSGGMHVGEPGYLATLHVRLMHAQVRRLATVHPRWDTAAWGLPINQHDMLATILLFSSVFVEGVRAWGVRVSDQEADDFQHLYRFIGWLIGVEEDLLPQTYQEAARAMDFIRLTQGAPDHDSRELVGALLDGPLRAARTPAQKRRAKHHVRVATGLCRAQLGDDLADQLGLPRDLTRFIVPGVRGVLGGLEELRTRYGLDAFVESLGSAYWKKSVSRVLGNERARFSLPTRLRVA